MRAVVGAWLCYRLMASGYMRRAGARTGVMPPGRGQAGIVINIIFINMTKALVSCWQKDITPVEPY